MALQVISNNLLKTIQDAQEGLVYIVDGEFDKHFAIKNSSGDDWLFIFDDNLTLVPINDVDPDTRVIDAPEGVEITIKVT